MLKAIHLQSQAIPLSNYYSRPTCSPGRSRVMFESFMASNGSFSLKSKPLQPSPSLFYSEPFGFLPNDLPK